MTRFALHYFFFFVTYAVITPFFQVFLAARGFDEAQVGLLQGVFSLAGAVGAVVVGRLADRHGKRRALLLAALAASAAALAPMNWLTGFLPAAVLAALFGVAYKSTIPLADALAASELPDPARQYGAARAMGSLGFIVMLWTITLLGLIDATSSTSVLLCFLATVAVSIPISARLPDTHKAAPRRTGGRDGGFGAPFWLLMTVVLLAQAGMAAHYSFFSLFLKAVYHVANPGWVWSIGALAEMPMIFFAGFFLRRLGVVGMIACSLAAASIRLAIYAAAPPLAVIIAAQLLHACTFGMSHTAAIEFIRRAVPRARQGQAMAVYTAIILGLAQMLGSTLGGHLIASAGYAPMYLVHAAAPLLGLALLLASRKRLAAE